MRAHRSRSARGLLAALLACGVACGPSRAPARAPLEVFAAASLREAFEALAREHEAAHPEVDVRLTFAGSQVLRLQIEQGARADVFASADEAHVEALVAAGLAREPVAFAENELVLVVPRDDAAGLGEFQDLPRARSLVLGAPTVPAGRYADEALRRAGDVFGPEFLAAVRARVASRESNVRLARAKVELGEADAALVYRTDALAGAGLRTIELPQALRVRARYVVAVVAAADSAPAARAWIELLRGPRGRDVLAAHGFGALP